ncbi:hypothetical protein ACIQZO_04150 [Streptomyces sp. NPDC097617]
MYCEHKPDKPKPGPDPAPGPVDRENPDRVVVPHPDGFGVEFEI